MRRRFFVDQVRNGHAEISGDEAGHLTRVLRAEAGQRFEISDNHDVYLAEIEVARRDRVVFRTLEKLVSQASSAKIVLCASLIRLDRFEWMLEKATELGVSEIIPLETSRTERGFRRAALKRMERWRRIVLEASQQSRRATLPAIREPAGFESALVIQAPRRYALDEQPGGAPPTFAAGDVAILTGPEGGWTEKERESFLAAGWEPVSLGPLILRAETAALAALSIVNWTRLLH